MRRAKLTTYGQRGGEGPNTGKRAVTFRFVRPDGVEARTRVFKNPPESDGFVVLYPPYNSHGWLVGQVKARREDFDELLRSAEVDRRRWSDTAPLPVVVEATRLG